VETQWLKISCVCTVRNGGEKGVNRIYLRGWVIYYRPWRNRIRTMPASTAYYQLLHVEKSLYKLRVRSYYHQAFPATTSIVMTPHAPLALSRIYTIYTTACKISATCSALIKGTGFVGDH
jgi:hypothetical protein